MKNKRLWLSVTLTALVVVSFTFKHAHFVFSSFLM